MTISESMIYLHRELRASVTMLSGQYIWEGEPPDRAVRLAIEQLGYMLTDETVEDIIAEVEEEYGYYW